MHFLHKIYAEHPTAWRFDILVDANLAQDEPEALRFNTLQAAVAAAPEGTAEHPTVIGIRPNVYPLPGGSTEPGLKIRKNNLTLLGLTNDRRSVVLADNRGLQQGADNNGYLLDVNAIGFTCRNLTIINHCNIDYEYPGDPGKNLKKRSDVITQAVALDAKGDRHVYENVAILSRLDTMFLSAQRAYFKNVHIEGTDHWVGGGEIAYWEDCTLAFPTGYGVSRAMNAVFRNCRFISGKGLQFYKVGFGNHNRPSALIDCSIELSAPNGRAAWMREPAPEHPIRYSLFSNLTDAGGNPLILRDSSRGEPTFNHSQQLTKDQQKAFTPWNLLRAVPGEQPDNWNPADDFQTLETLPYRIELPNGGSFKIRTGNRGASVSAAVTPVFADDPTITWTTDSDLIRLEHFK